MVKVLYFYCDALFYVVLHQLLSYAPSAALERTRVYSWPKPPVYSLSCCVAGRADLLEPDEEVINSHYKMENIDLSAILTPAETLRPGVPQRCVTKQDHGLETGLDYELIELAAAALAPEPEKVELTMEIRNTHRAVGTMLSYEVRRYIYEPSPRVQCSLPTGLSLKRRLNSFL